MLVVVLLGGFTTNFIWCVLLNIKNKTGYQYFSRDVPRPRARPRGGDDHRNGHRRAERGSRRAHPACAQAARPAARAPCCANYFFCALAGTTWYMQFFFYTHGRDPDGQTTSSPVGPCTWPASSSSARSGASPCRSGRAPAGGPSRWSTIGLAVLVGSTIIVGYGNYLASPAGSRRPWWGRFVLVTLRVTMRLHADRL